MANLKSGNYGIIRLMENLHRKGEPWTNRPDIAARLLVFQGQLVLEMAHEGQISWEEAGALYTMLFQQERLRKEVNIYQQHEGVIEGVMPLDSQTVRLSLLRLRMGRTEPETS